MNKDTIIQAYDSHRSDPDYECHDYEGGGYGCSYVGNQSASAGW